ncbi:MAG TPA: hypothetical protein VFF73_12710, partial [Planctomycetota bacterium]|nr:hypothetical protein [Planctomycetota bacterium]
KTAQIDVANSGHAIPSMESVATSDAFFHARALAGLQVHAEPNVTSLKFAEPNPTLLTWQEVRETLRIGLEGLWNGTQRDARAVLVQLDEPIAKIVANEDKLRRHGARE